jgi:hypothetical protein
MVTSISGIISFRFTARKNPAAPPPMIAVFIVFTFFVLAAKIAKKGHFPCNYLFVLVFFVIFAARMNEEYFFVEMFFLL